MRTRHQKGHVFEKNGWWYVRYYDNVMQEDGSVTRSQCSARIAEVCDDYPNERKVRPLVDEFLLPVNSGRSRPESTMTLERFVRTIYFPFIESERRPSTCKGYKDMWNNHIKPRCGSVRLRDFRTCDGQRVLAEIARQTTLTRLSLQHIKTLMSGIFKHAKRYGALDGVNPMQDVSTPRAREGRETYAYSAAEIMHMLRILPIGAAAPVAVAGLAGLRKGEIRGLHVEDYQGKELRVRRSIWNGDVLEPKTRQSRSAVPVIEKLASVLDEYLTVRCDHGPYLFNGPSGKAQDLDNLSHRVIKPTIKAAGLKWHGWHAFRRGLGTNLGHLGVRDKLIQQILRHSDQSVTQRYYIKPIPSDVVEAMGALDALCTKHAPPADSEKKPDVVN